MIKCEFHTNLQTELEFYPTEPLIPCATKILLMFVPTIALMALNPMSLIFKILLVLSLFLKVWFYLLLLIDLQGFKSLYQALTHPQSLIDNGLSTLKISTKQKKSLRILQDAYLLEWVLLAFSCLEFLTSSVSFGLLCLCLTTGYECFIFYKPSHHLKQTIAQCFIRLKG